MFSRHMIPLALSPFWLKLAAASMKRSFDQSSTFRQKQPCSPVEAVAESVASSESGDLEPQAEAAEEEDDPSTASSELFGGSLPDDIEDLHAAWSRGGPTSLEGILTVCPDRVRDVASELKNMPPEVIERVNSSIGSVIDSGIVLTSCFSGVGTFEGSARQVLDTWADCKGFVGAPNCVCFASTDVMPSAQRVLLAHPAASRSRHVFSDVLDRLFPADREELLEIQGKALAEYSNLKEEQRMDNINKKDMLCMKSRLSEEMMQHLLEVFRRVEFQTDAPCLVHKRRRPFSPAWAPHSFSTTGSRQQDHHAYRGRSSALGGNWLSTSTVPTVCWLFFDGLR